MSDHKPSDSDLNEKYGVIGYGSLLNPKEIRGFLDLQDRIIFPVTVKGFERIFNNEATWRTIEGRERAVLNVRSNKDSSINAVLLELRSQDEWEEYKEREGGYDFKHLSKDRIQPIKEDDEMQIKSFDRIYIPIGNRTSPDLLPIGDYVKTCLEGAQYWQEQVNEEFYSEFISTTSLADGSPFRNYISDFQK